MVFFLSPLTFMARHLLGILPPLVQRTHNPSRCYSEFFFSSSSSSSYLPPSLVSVCSGGGVPGTKSPQGRTKAITIDRFFCAE